MTLLSFYIDSNLFILQHLNLLPNSLWVQFSGHISCITLFAIQITRWFSFQFDSEVFSFNDQTLRREKFAQGKLAAIIGKEKLAEMRVKRLETGRPVM